MNGTRVIKTQKPTLSWSAISQFVNCSRQYWHARIARTPTGPKASALIEGTCGHAALQYFYEAKRDSRVLDVKEVVEYFNDYWSSAIVLEEFEWKETRDFRRRQVQRGLEGHLETIAPHVEPMFIEKEWRITLPECSHDVSGVCDLVATDFTVHDHKFVNRLPPERKDGARGELLPFQYRSHDVDDAAHWDFGGYGAQLTCYAMARAEGAFRPIDNWTDIPLYLNVSLKGGHSKQVVTTRNREQIMWFRRALVDIARAVEAHIYFPNAKSCRMCDYREPCRGNI